VFSFLTEGWIVIFHQSKIGVEFLKRQPVWIGIVCLRVVLVFMFARAVDIYVCVWC